MLWCEGPKHEDGCLSKHSPWADGTDCGLNRYDPQDSKHQPQDRYYEINPLAQRRKRSFCSVSTFFLKLFFPPKTRFLYQLLRLSRGSVTSPSLCRPIILHHIARQEVCDGRFGGFGDCRGAIPFWCKRGECIRKNYRALTPVNGDWGEWSAYSSCSRSCGGGIAQSERLCDSPKPENGGRYCLGRRMRYKSCNTKECLVESKSFRDVQCEVFNGVNFDLKDIPAHPKWVPKFYTEVILFTVPKKDSCRLICSVNGTSMYHILKEKVTDGTPCRPDYYDICVNGICVVSRFIIFYCDDILMFQLKAGCDHILGSSAKGDMCNVCQGDNSTCRVVSGSFNASRYGYNLVKVIPAGAANLKVEQKGYQGLSKDDNYLVLRTDDGYILNGNFILQSFELKLFYGGVEIEYSGSNTTVEKISTRRRLKKDVFLEVLTVGHLYPPDITYQYTVPLEDDETYKWHVQEEWTECTKVCKGEKYRRVVCTRIFDRALVDDDHCDYQPKPDILASVCNLHCSLKWHIFGESECSSRCSVGIKQRTIKCVQEIDQGEKHPLHDRYCEELESKPEEFVECVGDCSEVFWKLEEWSECSKTCGGGVQSRVATCVDSNNKVLKDRECSSLSKQTVRHCNTRGCPKWDYANWSACSVSCGTGKRIRTMWCQQDNQVVSNAYCDSSITPSTEEECILKECTMWDHGNWGPCSVTCGEGFTQRTVRCLSESGKELSPFYCDYFKRPKDTMECDLPGCVTTMTSTESSTSTSTSFYYNSTIFYPSTVITKKKASPPPSRSRIDDKYRIAQRISPIWKTGSWTEKVSKSVMLPCHDEGTGKRLPDDMCDSSAKPTGHQKCRDKSCGNWRTGEWSKCTVSCGEGIQLRHVICVLIDSQVEVFDDQCDAADRPPTETLCSMANCQNVIDHPQLTSYPATYPTDWITDEWGPCSQSCGGGYKQRQVKCQDIHHKESEFCDSEKRPTGTIRCNVEACPTWTTAQWSECSATCGKGMRVREILCHSSIGQELSHHYCDQSTKLESTEGCHSTKACIEKIEYYWQKESWSKLPVVEEPVSEQSPVLLKDLKQKNLTNFVPKQNRGQAKSVEEAPAQSGDVLDGQRCVLVPLNPCSSLCNGTQVRSTECRHKRRVVDAALCGGKDRQPSVLKRVCNVRKKCVYRWRSKSWSQCSKPCGTGFIHRKVMCVDVSGQPVPDKLCKRRKPRTKGKCNAHSCGHTWKAESWSLCTHSCDIGIQTRDVTCHRVNAYGWIIPRPVLHDKCNQSTRPQSVRRCNYGSCLYQNSPSISHQVQGIWKVGSWKTVSNIKNDKIFLFYFQTRLHCIFMYFQCSSVCGRGVSRRRVKCTSHFGKKLLRKYCDSRLKPPKKRICWLRPCAMMNCKDVQKRLYNYRDGEYYLFVQGKKVKMYCASMNTSSPREYITLASGQTENYSEIYSKRLLQPKSCPANGQRDENCACRNDYKLRAGFTSFRKIRLNITTLQVITNDFTFSETRGSKKIKYGEAGDCYSAAKCPQGQFSINLSHTDFIVWNSVRWKANGMHAAIKIHKTNNGFKVQGKCGGYCGSCYPDHSKGGLILDMAPP
ncbi:A disintegrin and metalloproteinase with thrombospondin motifs 9 [Nymphon striatum]|nr:A disintegrin and metalloproteinase with thrombospondin motifs 9 [Nymphon striatum]